MLSDYIHDKPVLRTDKLVLRSLRPDDVPTLREWMSDKSMYKYWDKNAGKVDFDWAVAEASRKKGIDCSKAEFLTLKEGLCTQIMHHGSYDDEPATVAILQDFIKSEGYSVDIDQVNRFHHGIYLSDPVRPFPKNGKL